MKQFKRWQYLIIFTLSYIGAFAFNIILGFINFYFLLENLGAYLLLISFFGFIFSLPTLLISLILIAFFYKKINNNLKIFIGLIPFIVTAIFAVTALIATIALDNLSLKSCLQAFLTTLFLSIHSFYISILSAIIFNLILKYKYKYSTSKAMVTGSFHNRF